MNRYTNPRNLYEVTAHRIDYYFQRTGCLNLASDKAFAEIGGPNIREWTKEEKSKLMNIAKEWNTVPGLCLQDKINSENIHPTKETTNG